MRAPCAVPIIKWQRRERLALGVGKRCAEMPRGKSAYGQQHLGKCAHWHTQALPLGFHRLVR